MQKIMKQWFVINMLLTSLLYGINKVKPQAQSEQKVLKGSISIEMLSPNLSEYLKLALKQNPEIKSAYHQWQSELKSIHTARGLPDIKINYGYFLENIETAVGPQEWKIGFMQTIPWPGKLKVQGDIQSFKADAAHEKLKGVIANLIFQVQTIYLDVYFLEQSIMITRENLQLVRQWEQIILTKFRTASAKHPDLIKTQIEAIKLEDDLATLESRRLPLSVQFMALLNEDTLSQIILPESLENPDAFLNRDEIRTAILNHNPELASRKSMQNAAGKTVTRTKLNWLPDFSVGVDYMSTGDKWMGGQLVSESGKDPLVIMGSLTLPLWGYKQAGQVRSAREAEQQAEATVENTRNTLEAVFENAWFAYEDAKRKWHLYQNRLLPKSLESLRATEKAYIVGEMEFLSLVDAQRRHLNFTLAAEKSKVDYFKSVAQLLKLAGRTE